MPLFFFAAGYVYKRKNILSDIKRRAETIVIPYFSFGILILSYWIVIERKFRESSMSSLEAIFGLIRGQYDFLDFNVHMWFLTCFFVLAIFYNIMENVFGKKPTYIISIVMSIVFIIVLLPHLPWGIDWIFKYIGFYTLGNVVAENKIMNIVSSKNRIVQFIIAIILIVINFAVACYFSSTGIMWFINGTIGSLGFTVMSILIDYNKILQYLGRISLVVLCIHGPVYRIIVKVLSVLFDMNTDSVREKFILAMIVVAITLGISSVVHEIVKKIAPWMIGKKRNN